MTHALYKGEYAGCVGTPQRVAMRNSRRPSVRPPLKHGRYAKPMTLCIGALASAHRSPKIVTCSDMMLGDDYHSVLTEKKTEIGLTETLAALYAGPWEDVANLKRVLARHVRALPLTLDNHRGVLIEAWRDFNLIPRTEQPTESDVQCIVAGFIEGTPRIIRVDRSGVQPFPFFTSIGIGAYHAETILMWRGLQQYSSLGETLYSVYEARQFGEMCSSVGGTTIMHILDLNQDGKLDVDIVLGTGISVMAGWFKKYGPQPLGNDLRLDPNLIARIGPHDY